MNYFKLSDNKYLEQIPESFLLIEDYVSLPAGNHIVIACTYSAEFIITYFNGKNDNNYFINKRFLFNQITYLQFKEMSVEKYSKLKAFL